MRYFTPVKRYLYGVLLACFIQTPLAHAALIGLQPNTTFASNGDTIALDLVVSGLGSFGPESLGAFDISVGFDPGALSFTSYTLGDFLGDPDLSEAIDASAGVLGGTVNLAEISLLSESSLDALQPGAFTLGTLNFNVTNLAMGEITQLSILRGWVLADASGNRLAADVSGPANVEGRDSSVPVPGTLLLMMAASFALLTLKKRQFNLLPAR